MPTAPQQCRYFGAALSFESPPSGRVFVWIVWMFPDAEHCQDRTFKLI